MKRKGLALALAVTLITGMGASVYAANTDTSTGSEAQICTSNGSGLGKTLNLRGHDVMEEFLKSKGVTEQELNSDKTLSEIREEKGISLEETKQYMLTEKTKAVDEAVTAGKITTEEGQTIKNRISENTANCTGEGQGQNRGNNRR